MKNNEYNNYVGTKIIKAKLATLEEYKKEKYGAEAKINEGDSSIYGYIVMYPQIGNEDELPYISWSPKYIFEKCYRQIENVEIELLLDI